MSYPLPHRLKIHIIYEIHSKMFQPHDSPLKIIFFIVQYKFLYLLKLIDYSTLKNVYQLTDFAAIFRAFGPL